MCSIFLLLHRCPVSPSRTRRTPGFLTPWGICLHLLSWATASRRLQSRPQTELWQRSMGDFPVLPGPPRCPATSLASPPAPQQPLPERWCSWPLRRLWSGRPAPPHVLKAPGAALIPMIPQRWVTQRLHAALRATVSMRPAFAVF